MDIKRFFRGPVFWALLALAAIGLAVSLFASTFSAAYADISVKHGLELLDGNTVTKAKIIDGEQRVTLELSEPDGKGGPTKVQFWYVAPRGLEIVAAVNASNPKEFNDEVPQSNIIVSILGFILPFAILILLFWFLLSRMQGGGSRVMQFGKSKAKLVGKETPTVTFADVAGADEAVEELEEIKDFLKDPGKFLAVGARIPKGVLLYGPPGTGKTLLARAVAGEAGVPFYTISGSDFVEMFVGVGASRVRDLFDQAKQNAPAIIFIDEIDAVGRHRGAGIGGGNDEREQTLNQLLVEMDGFDANANVILIAATNRPDVLDPALLRPGRFDRQIGVDSPDLQGRKQILEVHGKGKPLAKGVDLEVLARKTPGFTGADLANVLNEAALLTARSNAQLIDNRALDEAVDRVIAGPQRRTRLMNDKEKLITAYHEAGHALAAASMRNTDPVTKVTILPRGRALGYTMVNPIEDKYSISRNELLDRLAYGMGGRVAEEIVFHDPTTGASNDIEKATATARRMVTEFGMSARVGSVKLGASQGEPFMGRDLGATRDYSDDVAKTIDDEVRALIDQAHDEAWQVLNTNRDILDTLASELLEKESLDNVQLAKLFEKVVKLPPRPQWLSSESRPLSDRPPVGVPMKAPIDQGVVDGGVDSEPPAKPKSRTPRPRKTPGIATA